MTSKKIKIYYALVLVFTLVASFFAGYYTTLRSANHTLDKKSDSGAVAQVWKTPKTDLISTSTKIFKREKYVKGVEYVVQTVESASSEMLGMDMTSAEKIFKNKGYIILTFNSNQIIISKDIDSWPPNAYVVKGDNGSINIYRVSDNSKLIFEKSTDLKLEDLPDQDKEELIKGKIYESKEAIEDLIDEYKS